MPDFRLAGGRQKHSVFDVALSAVATLVYNTQVVGAGATNIAPYGMATASSFYSQDANNTYPPSNAINGDRKGINWGTAGTGGGWNDATANVFPDWFRWDVPTDVSGNPVPQSFNAINLFFVQDNYQAPVDPTPEMTFTQWGLISFDIEYWTGAAWAPVPNGSIRNNNKVWVQILFPPLATTAFRVVTNASASPYSAIVEFEAITTDTPAPFAPAVSWVTPSEGKTYNEGSNVPLVARVAGHALTGVAITRNGATIYASGPRSDFTYAYTDVSPAHASYTYQVRATTSWGQDKSLDLHVQVNEVVAPPSTYPTTGVDNFDILKGLSFAYQGLRLIDPGPDDINLEAVTMLNEDNWNDPQHRLKGCDAVTSEVTGLPLIPIASGTGLRCLLDPNEPARGNGDWFNNPTVGGVQKVVKNIGDVMTMMFEVIFNGVNLTTDYIIPGGDRSSGKIFDWNRAFSVSMNTRSTTSTYAKIVTSKWRSNHFPITYNQMPTGGQPGIELYIASASDYDKQPRMDQDGTKAGADRILHYRDSINPENAGKTFWRGFGGRGYPWAEPCAYQSRIEVIRDAPEAFPSYGVHMVVIRWTLKAHRYNQPWETVTDAFVYQQMPPEGLGAHFLFPYYTGVQSAAGGSPLRAPGAWAEYRNYLCGSDWFPEIVHVAPQTWVSSGAPALGWDSVAHTDPLPYKSALKATWDTTNITFHEELFDGAWSGYCLDDLLDEIFKVADGGHTVSVQNGFYKGNVTGDAPPVGGWKLLQTSSFVPYRSYPASEDPNGNDIHRSFHPDGRPFGSHSQDAKMLFRRRDGVRGIYQCGLFRGSYISPGPWQQHAGYLAFPDIGNGVADVGEKILLATMDSTHTFAVDSSNGVTWLPSDIYGIGYPYISSAYDPKRGYGWIWDAQGRIWYIDFLPISGQPTPTLFRSDGNYPAIDAGSCIDIRRELFIIAGRYAGQGPKGTSPGFRHCNVQTGELGWKNAVMLDPDGVLSTGNGITGWNFCEEAADTSLCYDWVTDSMFVGTSLTPDYRGDPRQWPWGILPMASFDAGTPQITLKGHFRRIASIQGNVQFSPRRRGWLRMNNPGYDMERWRTF